jgi:hypothetical protein
VTLRFCGRGWRKRDVSGNDLMRGYGYGLQGIRSLHLRYGDNMDMGMVGGIHDSTSRQSSIVCGGGFNNWEWI